MEYHPKPPSPVRRTGSAGSIDLEGEWHAVLCCGCL
jgi:hypothetical protein